MSYNWQFKNTLGNWVNVVNGTPVGGSYTRSTSNAITISAITSTGNYEYRCRISSAGNGCGTATSITSTLNVVADPSISTQPVSNSTVCLNGTLTLSTIAANGTPSLSYQWYSNTTNSNTGGTPILGATSASYSVPTGSAGNFYYYCVVSAPGNGCNDITTNVSVVTIINLTNTNSL